MLISFYTAIIESILTFSIMVLFAAATARDKAKLQRVIHSAEKYRDGQRELHCVFVDLEKAYDRVPREELWYCMRKSGVAEKYVRVVQDMYERNRTVVRCAVGQTEEFNVEVELHQGSALSPFLFAIVMDQLSEEVRQESPWTMMFADDIVICSESREQVEENLERWRFALEKRGMKRQRDGDRHLALSFIGGHRSAPRLGGGCCSALRLGAAARRCGSALRLGAAARRCGSAVDVARPCGSAVDVARLCCSTVDVARRLRSVVDVVWDPLALPSGPVFLHLLPALTTDHNVICKHHCPNDNWFITIANRKGLIVNP
ncbi:hypothetical protein QTP86_006312 [Hemibagrus guttatus]|nr:hypothetical protein QTP86_006312 [Hemibagrus guttatus]